MADDGCLVGCRPAAGVHRSDCPNGGALATADVRERRPLVLVGGDTLHGRGPGAGDLERPDGLILPSDFPDDLDGAASGPPEPLTRDEMLEAIPLHVTLWDEVDLDAADPAEAGTRRQCVAVRKAGGRCTATAPANSLLCNAHSGRLDPRMGGLARAAAARDASESQEERERVGRLGTRALIADTLAAQGLKVKRTVEVLLDAASQGDLQAAKAVIPYLNQGLGMPTERVELGVPETGADLEAMSTADLARLVAERRSRATG